MFDLKEKLKNKTILLASKSPRRQELLKSLDIEFKIPYIQEISEYFPINLTNKEIPLFLSEKKAKAYKSSLKNNEILITADTIVWADNQVLNKPKDYNQAFEMINKLSGKSHFVYTGVCLSSVSKQKSFVSETKVFLKKLSANEIEYYIKQYKPYDKAGAYGIQEWIGYIGITKIEGSYFNVMGLPVQQLYLELLNF